jgi:hypothetical protein
VSTIQVAVDALVSRADQPYKTGTSGFPARRPSKYVRLSSLTTRYQLRHPPGE